eukprot:11171760-Lingulodinium_polyedra.AAC.1
MVLFESINVSSLDTNLAFATERRADYVAVQEHLVTSRRRAAVRQRARDAGWDLDLGCLDPEAGRPAGG